MRLIIIFALLGIIGLSFAGTIGSPDPINNCQEMDTSGYYYLNTNLVGAPIAVTGGNTCLHIINSSIVIDGRGYNITNDGTANASAIYGNGISNFTFFNSSVSQYQDDNYGGGQIEFDHSSDLSFYDLVVYNGSGVSGFDFYNVTDLEIYNTEVFDHNRSAIRVDLSQDIEFYNLEVHDIFSFYHCDWMMNCHYDSDPAIRIINSNNLEFYDSQVYDLETEGVDIQNLTGADIYRIEVFNLSDIPDEGDASLLILETVRYVYLEDSLFHDSEYSCVEIHESQEDEIAVENSVFDNLTIYNCAIGLSSGDNPFDYEEYSTNNSYTNLHIFNNTLGMILSAHNDTILSNLNISDNIISGLTMASSSHTNISNSNFTENGVVDLIDAPLSALMIVGLVEFVPPLLQAVLGPLGSGELNMSAMMSQMPDGGAPDCSTTLTNVTGSGGRPILYLRNNESVDGGVYSEILVCAGNNSYINSSTVLGSDTLHNNGLFVMGGSKMTIKNYTSNGNAFGMVLVSVADSLIINNTINDSTVIFESQLEEFDVNISEFIDMAGLNSSDYMDVGEFTLAWKVLGLAYGSVTTFGTINTTFSNNLIQNNDYSGFISFLSFWNTYDGNLIRSNNQHAIGDLEFSIPVKAQTVGPVEFDPNSSTDITLTGLDTIRSGFISIAGFGDSYSGNIFYNNTGAGFTSVLTYGNSFNENQAYNNSVSGYVTVLGAHNTFVGDQAYQNNPEDLKNSFDLSLSTPASSFEDLLNYTPANATDDALLMIPAFVVGDITINAPKNLSHNVEIVIYSPVANLSYYHTPNITSSANFSPNLSLNSTYWIEDSLGENITIHLNGNMPFSFTINIHENASENATFSKLKMDIMEVAPASGGFVNHLSIATRLLGVQSYENNGYGVADFAIPPISVDLNVGESVELIDGPDIFLLASLQLLLNLVSTNIPGTLIIASTVSNNSMDDVNTGSLILPYAKTSKVVFNDAVGVSLETGRGSLFQQFMDTMPMDYFATMTFIQEDEEGDFDIQMRVGNIWEEDSSYLNGLPLAMNNSPTLETFVYNNNIVLLISNSTNVSAYTWNGSIWQPNASWASGLNGMPVAYPIYPAVFEMDGYLHMIYGTSPGNLFGLTWTGSTWTINASLTNGITGAPAALSASPTVFYDRENYKFVLVVGYELNNNLFVWTRSNGSSSWFEPSWNEFGDDAWNSSHGALRPRAYYSEKFNEEIIIIGMSDGTFACTYWDDEHEEIDDGDIIRCPPDITQRYYNLTWVSPSTPVRIDDTLMFLVSNKTVGGGNFTAFVSDDSDIEIGLYLHPLGYRLSGIEAPSATTPPDLIPFHNEYFSLIRSADLFETSVLGLQLNDSLGKNYDPLIITIATFEWARANMSGYDEDTVGLYWWNGTDWFLVPNQYVIPSKYRLVVLNLQSYNETEIYGLFADEGPDLNCTGSSNTEYNYIDPDVDVSHDCVDGLEVSTHTASGDPWVNINVGFGYTDQNGIFTYGPLLCAVDCTTDLDCPTYQECVGGQCEPIECSCGQIVEHTCQEYDCCTNNDCGSGSSCINHNCVSVETCTSDGQCLSSEYCDLSLGVGICKPVSSTCGYAANHQWTAYDCGDSPDCPSCAPGFVCEVHECVALPSDLTGPDSGFVGDDVNFHAVNCPQCQVQITDPRGKNMSALTSSSGNLTLPLSYNGTYTLTLVKGSVPIKTASVRALSKSPGVEPGGPSFINDVALPGALMALLLALIIVFLYSIFTRNKPKINE
ncbi:MAG: hypothetical protein ABH842_05150 [Candidatus Micrarchaeota archaeon]